MTALELAKYCNVSKRTILRDIDDLENQGVKKFMRIIGKMVVTKYNKHNLKLH